MIFWLFSSALLSGFFASSHCVVMCAPLAGALGSQLPRHARPLRLLLLNAGRILSYSAAGAAVGALGGFFIKFQQQVAAVLQLLAGGFLFAMAAYIAMQWQGLRRIETVGQPIWALLSRTASRWLPIDSTGKALAYGMVWGFLPCGLIYTNLSVALSTGSALSGAVWMTGFGIGTSLAVIASLIFSRQIIDLLQEQWVKIVAAIALICYACTLIYLALTRLVF